MRDDESLTVGNVEPPSWLRRQQWAVDDTIEMVRDRINRLSAPKTLLPPPERDEPVSYVMFRHVVDAEKVNHYLISCVTPTTQPERDH